jgi:hypothetical protein
MSFAAVDWGTVPEWLTGIGAVLVAAVLGGLAIKQANSANFWAKRSVEVQETSLVRSFEARVVTESSTGKAAFIRATLSGASVWVHKVTVGHVHLISAGWGDSMDLTDELAPNPLITWATPKHLQNREYILFPFDMSESTLSPDLTDVGALDVHIHWSTARDDDIVYDTEVRVDLPHPAPPVG